MDSRNWEPKHKTKILNLLNNIIAARVNDLEKYVNLGHRSRLFGRKAEDDGHTRVLALVVQLKNLVEVYGINFNHEKDLVDSNFQRDTPITETPGYDEVSSDIASEFNRPPRVPGKGRHKDKRKSRRESRHKDKRKSRRKDKRESRHKDKHESRHKDKRKSRRKDKRKSKRK